MATKTAPNRINAARVRQIHLLDQIDAAITAGNKPHPMLLNNLHDAINIDNLLAAEEKSIAKKHLLAAEQAIAFRSKVAKTSLRKINAIVV